MNKRPKVSIKILLRYKNQVLMLKEPDGTFNFPGGTMEWRESILGTLKRELIEELNYSLKREPDFFSVWNFVSKDKKRHIVLIHYIYFLDKKPKLVSQEKAEILWVTKKDMEALGIAKNKKFRDKIFKDTISQDYPQN